MDRNGSGFVNRAEMTRALKVNPLVRLHLGLASSLRQGSEDRDAVEIACQRINSGNSREIAWEEFAKNFGHFSDRNTAPMAQRDFQHERSLHTREEMVDMIRTAMKGIDAARDESAMLHEALKTARQRENTLELQCAAAEARAAEREAQAAE